MNFSKQLTTTTLKSAGVTSKKVATNAVTTQRYMSAFSHMSDNNPEVLEREKQKHLNSKNKEWNETLASASEASVKADKEADVPIKDLQEKSAKDHAKKHNEE